MIRCTEGAALSAQGLNAIAALPAHLHHACDGPVSEGVPFSHGLALGYPQRARSGNILRPLPRGSLG